PPSPPICTALERALITSPGFAVGRACKTSAAEPATMGALKEVPHPAAKLAPGKVVTTPSPGAAKIVPLNHSWRTSCADQYSWWRQCLPHRRSWRDRPSCSSHHCL